MSADVLAFTVAHKVYVAPYYDRRAVVAALADIQRAIVVIQEQAGLTCDLQELAICELSLESGAVCAVAAREFIAALPGTRQSVES